MNILNQFHESVASVLNIVEHRETREEKNEEST